MGHINSSGPTWNSNRNETSSFSSVWGAASLRTGDSDHGHMEEAGRGSGEGWHNGNNDGTRGQGGTSSADRRQDHQIDSLKMSGEGLANAVAKMRIVK